MYVKPGKFEKNAGHKKKRNFECDNTWFEDKFEWIKISSSNISLNVITDWKINLNGVKLFWFYTYFVICKEICEDARNT